MDDIFLDPCLSVFRVSNIGKGSCSLEKLYLGTMHGQTLVVASIADSCQAGIGPGNHDGAIVK